MKKRKKWSWLLQLLTVFLVLFALIAVAGWYVDPYMRYHAPRLEEFYYFYESGDERAVSPAIVRYLPTDGIITGTSMTENFKASEAERLFGVSFQKLPLPGAFFGEVSNLLRAALQTNPELQVAIRSLDTYNFDKNEDYLPETREFYLEDLSKAGPFAQVQYLFNQDLLYGKTLPMLLNALGGGAHGITDFDSYCYWGHMYDYGSRAVVDALEVPAFAKPEQAHMTSEEETAIRDNVTRNVISLAEQYPRTQFYCFFPPYSAAWWGTQQTKGLLTKRFEQEKLVIELLLPYENIHLFSWNDQAQLTCDMNNYKDTLHYAPWVNSWMLEQMAAENGRLTRENYMRYLASEQALYADFDYSSIFTQEDPAGSTISAFFES